MTVHSNLGLDDMRCVYCGAEDIQHSSENVAAIQCLNCGHSYKSVWGVPYFGHFEREDILGLIEIAANISNRGKFGITPEVVEQWETLLSNYDSASDKESFTRANPEVNSPYFQNRYGEWVEVSRLLDGLDLNGMKVLDIGAGLGFDSHRLAMHGAKVTALEFSPLLAEAGQQNFPHIRWIGGFSHYLPFKAESFDAVFCNAALHHMRDIPATLSESLRVLRPGGVLITTCDSFRPSDSSEESEISIFDHNPAVLLGVNEGIPPLSAFTDVLRQQAKRLDIELYTHTLYRSPLLGGPLTELTLWNFQKNLKMLSRHSGSIALRVRLKEPCPAPALVQHEQLLAADTYADWLTSAASAIAKLAPLIPEQYVDLSFPGTQPSKFELLNGWRLRKPKQLGRTAYQRGRWFLRRPANAESLIFDLQFTQGAEAIRTFEVLLDGQPFREYTLKQGETMQVLVDIKSIPEGQVFAVEIRQLQYSPTLEDGEFEVKHRRFVFQQKIRINTGNGLREPITGEPSVFAVIPVFNRLNFTQSCIATLKAQTYQPLNIIVSDGGSTDGTVDVIQRDHPDVVVLTTDEELWWAGAMAQGIDYVLKQSQHPEDWVLMMNNDTEVPADYVEMLVNASRTHRAAVGALIVDSKDPDRVLDAGEYIDWASYTFPVKNTVEPGEWFIDDVDVLPGRGSLIPVDMIRTAGNVNASQWPHYLADYEFFYRLKQHGFRLGVCYETRLLAHIEETGIMPSAGVISFSAMWQELFSRRSLSNVVDHWRFVWQHAPAAYRLSVLLRLSQQVVTAIAFRTPLRVICLPMYWLLRLPLLGIAITKNQAKIFAQFFREIRQYGVDVLCYPHRIPKLIRIPAYFLLCPGPVSSLDCANRGLDIADLVSQDILRHASVADWYCLNTLKLENSDASTRNNLLWMTLNPFTKIASTLTWTRLKRSESKS
jgi:GT2 family glycosyltransferase/SAM-dependent methyltransferase